VGLRTSTPVLDLHTATSNTPAHRYEQTNAGGFAAQTWDVAGKRGKLFCSRRHWWITFTVPDPARRAYQLDRHIRDW